jgi:hypothetical protein
VQQQRGENLAQRISPAPWGASTSRKFSPQWCKTAPSTRTAAQRSELGAFLPMLEKLDSWVPGEMKPLLGLGRRSMSSK